MAVIILNVSTGRFWFSRDRTLSHTLHSSSSCCGGDPGGAGCNSSSCGGCNSSISYNISSIDLIFRDIIMAAFVGRRYFHTLATDTHLVCAAGGALHGWSVGVAAPVVVSVAEELGTDPGVVVAGPGAPVLSALGVQGDGAPRQTATPGQGQLSPAQAGGVVQTARRARPQEMLDLLDRAPGPGLAPGGVPQVRHDVARAPGAGLGPGPPEVGGGGVPVMDSAQQMPDLVGSHHHPRVAPAVLHQRHGGDLLEVGVPHTSSSYIRESRGRLYPLPPLDPRHVQPRHGHNNIING